MSDTLSILDFVEADTIEKRAALTKRIFQLILTDQRLNQFEPEQESDPRYPDDVLVFRPYGLQMFEISVRLILFGDRTMHKAIMVRILRNNNILYDIKIQGPEFVDGCVNTLVREVTFYIGEWGMLMDAKVSKARKRLIRAKEDDIEWQNLPIVTVPEYRHGFHAVGDVFCRGPARFHVLSHDRTNCLVDHLCPMIVFSCPWMDPIQVLAPNKNSIIQFLEAVKQHLLTGEVAAEVAAELQAEYLAHLSIDQP